MAGCPNCRIKENAEVSLHDCRASKISYEDGFVTFFFPDGFYLLDGGGATLTGDATMRCRLIYRVDDDFAVRSEKRTFLGKIVREVDPHKFVDTVNEENRSFEFVSTYRSYEFILFTGCLWSDKAPHVRDYEIELHTDEIEYSWKGRPDERSDG